MLRVQQTGQVETLASPHLCERKASSPDFSSLHIEAFSGFGEIEAKWRKAQESCDCYGFQTFEWLSTWHRTIGATHAVEPRIIHVTDRSGGTLMLLPLGIERRLGLSFLTFLGGILTDYNAPIIRADFAASLDAASVDRLIALILKLLPKIDVIVLQRLPSIIDGVPNPLAKLADATHACSAWVATLGTTFAEFKKRRSKKFFSSAERKRRRLSEIGATAFIVADTSQAVSEIMRAFVRQKRRRWQELGSPDLFAEPGYLAFYSELAERHFKTGLIQTSALRVGQMIVATHLGMVFRGRFYWLMPTYEAGERSRFSVGRLLMQDLVEWSISQGIKRFDLTIGDETYKYLWADHNLPLHECVRGLTAGGLAYRQAYLITRKMTGWVGRNKTLRTVTRRLWRRITALVTPFSLR